MFVITAFVFIALYLNFINSLMKIYTCMYVMDSQMEKIFPKISFKRQKVSGKNSNSICNYILLRYLKT